MLKLIRRVFGFIAVPGALALAGCATVLPSGPDVVGVPSAGKDVAQFRQEEAACRSDAGQQIRAEIGVRDPLSFQQRYDLAYAQCLASKGDTVRPGRTPPGTSAATMTFPNAARSLRWPIRAHCRGRGTGRVFYAPRSRRTREAGTNHAVAGGAWGLLRLARQVGPSVFTDLAPRLVSVHDGLDQPDIVAAIRRAHGEWDKGFRHYVAETKFLRRLEDELRTVIDPLFRAA